MPLKREDVRGRPTLLYLLHLGQLVDPPVPETIEVGVAGAAAGALAIPVVATASAIPRNTILTFTEPAVVGPPAVDAYQVQVVVTEDAPPGATSLAVEAFHGADGDGISAPLTSAAEAVWDGLLTDVASQNLDFQKGATRQDFNSVTHGSGTGVTISQSEVSAIAPNIPRTGLFLPRSPLLEDILLYGDTNANWWARGVWPDERGRPYIVHEGLARITDVGTPAPADNLIQLNYTVRFSSLRTQFVPVP